MVGWCVEVPALLDGRGGKGPLVKGQGGEKAVCHSEKNGLWSSLASRQQGATLPLSSQGTTAPELPFPSPTHPPRGSSTCSWSRTPCLPEGRPQ